MSAAVTLPSVLIGSPKWPSGFWQASTLVTTRSSAASVAPVCCATVAIARLSRPETSPLNSVKRRVCCGTASASRNSSFKTGGPPLRIRFAVRLKRVVQSARRERRGNQRTDEEQSKLGGFASSVFYWLQGLTGGTYNSMTRSIARRQTAQKGTSSRVNMMQSSCGR